MAFGLRAIGGEPPACHGRAKKKCPKKRCADKVPSTEKWPPVSWKKSGGWASFDPRKGSKPWRFGEFSRENHRMPVDFPSDFPAMITSHGKSYPGSERSTEASMGIAQI